MGNADMSAKDRFEATRSAVYRLNDVKTAIMLEGEEWKPSQPKSRGLSDPTARKAIYRADELAQVLENLRHEEHELENYIGTSLALIEAVRKGLGDKYADILEWLYIDCASWTYIIDTYGVKRSTAFFRRGVAFDWIDSIGIRELLRGEYEL